MKFSHFFIDRPIFATVISILITILGIVGYFRLPISQYPSIVPPTITVSATYQGASPTTLMDTVVTPIEQELNGVENMMYISSQCNSDGSASIDITFELGTNIDVAQVLVQNRVNIATPRLPPEVKNVGVFPKKRSPDMLLAINIFSPDNTRDKLYMTNYAITQIKDKILPIYGVGDVMLFGAREYSMRIWLSPEKLANVDMTPSQVIKALREQNQQVAAGKLNQAPITNPYAAHELLINTQGRLKNTDEFENIIIKNTKDGKIVKLRDVARVELGAYSYSDESYLDGKPAVGFVVYQLPGTNAMETANKVKDLFAELKKDFPNGMDYLVAVDNTTYISESIEAVYRTIFEAIILVVFVMMLFLQNWKASIIPIFAIPVSLIGTFFFMHLFGFSINNLSLFGLVLAIGIVVDDAIVVVENVERNMRDGLNAREATKKAMSQVQGALIAIVLVLSSVFIPTAFIEGISGQFYSQFALTIAVSTILSGIVSLTLTPALTAIFLTHSDKPDIFTRVWDFCFGKFFKYFNLGFDFVASKYGLLVKKIVRLSLLFMIIYIGLLGITGYLFEITPKGFIPKQDTGYLFCAMQLPDGATLARSDETIRKAQNLIIKNIPEVRSSMVIAGMNGATRSKSSNAGAMFIRLHPKNERYANGNTLDYTIQKISQFLMKEIPEAIFFVIKPPTVNGIGVGGDFKALVQDRMGLGLDSVQKYTQLIAEKARESEVIASAMTMFRMNTPQLFVDIDREQAQRLNVPISSIFETMQFNLGSIYVNDFNILNRVYRVMAQAEGSQRTNISDISNLKVPSMYGGNVPLGSLAHIKRTIGPEVVSRYNLYPAAEVMGNLNKGYSTGQAIEEIERIAKEVLPNGMGIEWTDLAFQELRTGNTAMIIFALCVLFVFLLLSALYESWRLPLSVILVVPLVLLFAIIGVLMRGMDNNIMTQIGFVVLIGLACKNAILIVEFAKQRQEKGEEVIHAISEAAKNRLRPILMTSFAFILGVVPLAYATGAGSELRQALGTSVFFGMLGVTIFGLIFTPVFFYIIRRNFSSKK